MTITPHALPGVAPLRSVDAGSVRVFYDATPAELSRVRGHVRLAAPPASSLRTKRGSLSPIPDRPGHLMSRSRVHARLERPSVDCSGQSPHELAGGQREAIRTRAASPHLPRRRSGSAHPRCLPSMGSPEGLAQVFHRLSPICGVPGCGASLIDPVT
jgi:hypothetical protein